MIEAGLIEIVADSKKEEHCAECAACLNRNYWKFTNNPNLNPEQRDFEAEELIKGLCGNCNSYYYKDYIHTIRIFLNNIIESTKRT